MDEATAKALKALLEQLLVVAAGMQAVIEPATEQVDESETEKQVNTVEDAVTEIVEQAEEEREFKRKKKSNDALAASVARLEKQFSTMLNTAQGRSEERRVGKERRTRRSQEQEEETQD